MTLIRPPENFCDVCGKKCLIQGWKRCSKVCDGKHSHKMYLKNKERSRAYAKAYHETHRDYHRQYGIKRRAEMKAIKQLSTRGLQTT